MSNNKIDIDCCFRNYTKAELLTLFTEPNILSKTYSCFIGSGRHRGKMCGMCYGCSIRRTAFFATMKEEKDGEYVDDYLLIEPSSNTQSQKLHRIRNNIRFAFDILRGKPVIINRIQGRNLCGLFTISDVQSVFQRQAMDIALGLSRHLKSLNSANLGPLGKYIGKELKSIDQKIIESRSNQLRTQIRGEII